MKIASLLTLTAAMAAIANPQSAEALISPHSEATQQNEAGLQSFVAKIWNRPAFPFWKNIGQIDRSTGVYIGNGCVLTAAHVGPGDFRANDGKTYRHVKGTERYFTNKNGSRADMCFFRIRVPSASQVAKLPSIPLTVGLPHSGEGVLMLGAGAGKKSADKRGFSWNPDNRLRWGWNTIETVYDVPMKTSTFASYGYSTRFNRNGASQAAPGDSGGAVFRFNERQRRWELGGVIIAIDDQFGRANYGNQTYVADPLVFADKLMAARRQGGGAILAALR